MENNLLNSLQTTLFGQAFSKEELIQLINLGDYIVFEPGFTIVHQGKKTERMYIILSGTALVTTRILGEGGTYITTLGPGNLINETSLIEKSPCPTTIIANNRLEALLISVEYFEALNIFNKTTKYKMTVAIAHEITNRLKEMINKIKNFIALSSMLPFSFFASLVKTFNFPVEIPFDEKLANQLKNFLLFKNFSKFELDELISYAVLIKAVKNSTLIQEGDTHTGLFMLMRGAVQTSIVGEKKLAKLSVLGPPAIFCGLQILDETFQEMINYNTCEEALLFKIEWENILRLKKNNFSLWIKVFDLVCKTFAALERSANKLDVRLNSEIYNR